MTRARFIAVVYFCMIVAPLRFLEFQLAYIAVNALGKGRSVYTGTDTASDTARLFLPRLGTVLGFAYVVAMFVGCRYLVAIGRPAWIVPFGLLGMILAATATYALPDWAVFTSPFRQAYSCRFAGSVRLCFFTVVMMALAGIRWASSGHAAIYPFLLWFFPLISTFPFFMLLRDVYQHSNADSGRLTNSRVFFTDPFTRWAVFVYGQDMHIPHHLFPAIPHYHLDELHNLLKQKNRDYGETVVECHGTFHDSHGRTTILDEMTRTHDGDQDREDACALAMTSTR